MPAGLSCWMPSMTMAHGLAELALCGASGSSLLKLHLVRSCQTLMSSGAGLISSRPRHQQLRRIVCIVLLLTYVWEILLDLCRPDGVSPSPPPGTSQRSADFNESFSASSLDPGLGPGFDPGLAGGLAFPQHQSTRHRSIARPPRLPDMFPKRYRPVDVTSSQRA
ncbi:hypothetical protein GGR56DRAFT_176736 [Xylariaceae sp. FL0804]|nr:hypothetical protein GGR56DRAFT_176736 [Xylariaceae sp. FL0804]